MSAQPAQKVPKWMGPVFIILGILPMIFSKPSEGVPVWVAYLACSLFILAGMILIGQSFGLMWIGNILGPMIVLVFAVLASWIAFAPGERQCSSSTSFLWHQKEGVSSCTVPFGIGAVLCWLIFIFAIYSMIKKRKGNPR